MTLPLLSEEQKQRCFHLEAEIPSGHTSHNLAGRCRILELAMAEGMAAGADRERALWQLAASGQEIEAMTPTTTADASMEREAFEVWKRSQATPDWMLQMAQGDLKAGEYADSQCENEWRAWQARAAISETNASTERFSRMPEPNLPGDRLAPKEVAEPTRVGPPDTWAAGVETVMAMIRNPGFAIAGPKNDQWQQLLLAELAKRLPKLAPRTEAAAVAPDADYMLVPRVPTTQMLANALLESDGPQADLKHSHRRLRATWDGFLAAAPSNVREQALRRALRIIVANSTGNIRTIAADALDANLPDDAGKGETT